MAQLACESRRARPEISFGDIVEYAVESHEAGQSLSILKKCPIAAQAHFRAPSSAGLAPALHSVGLKLMIALPRARDDAYDYEYFGTQCRRDCADELRPALADFPAGPPSPRRTGFVGKFTSGTRGCSGAEDRRRHCELCLRLAHRQRRKRTRSAAEYSIQEALLHVEESETDVEFGLARR